MGIFPFLKKAPLFSEEESRRMVSAIRNSEKKTSGEVRVYIEAKNPYVDPMDRAVEIFKKLKMDQTEHRNAVLLYIAHKHHELALYGDEGIFKKAGKEFWETEVRKMISNIKDSHLVEGIIQCVLDIGATLEKTFPYEPTDDKNELPDDIVFGKL